LHRVNGWQGNEGYQKHIENAMKWFEISMKLNPYNGYCFMHYGMCLDYLGRTAEAGAYFKTLEKLDPNGYFAVAHQGWHRVQLGDYAAAKGFFEKSLQIKALNNPIATSYLGIVNRKLAEQAQTK
jgi:tetratricopeptide (TPR) repeat protein